MTGNGHHVIPVIGYPEIAGQGGVQKVQNPLGERISLQAQLGCDDRLLIRLAIDRSVGGGSELHAVGTVEDHLVNGIGKLFGAHPVQDHVSHSDLPREGLDPRLGINNAGQPVQFPLVVKCIARRDHTAAGYDVCRKFLLIPRNIRPVEGEFIKKLPDYASFIPEDQSLNSGSDREFLKEMLMMAKKYSDHPPISLILMLKSVNEEHKAEFKEAFYGVFFNIFKAFASIDGKFDKKEIELAAKLVQPLDDMTK